MKKVDNYAGKMKEVKGFVRKFIDKEIYRDFTDTDYIREYFNILTIIHSLNGKKEEAEETFRIYEIAKKYSF